MDLKNAKIINFAENTTITHKTRNVMKFKLGDRVKFMDTVGGGVVTKIIDKKQVLVRTNDGWEMPVLESELLKVEMPEDEQQAANDKVSQEVEHFEEEDFEEEASLTFDDDDIRLYMALLPTDSNNATGSSLELHLINDCDFHALFTASVPTTKDQVKPLSAGKLEANTKFYITTFERKEINKLSEVIFQFIFYRRTGYQLQETVTRSMKIKPVKLFKSKTFRENDFFHEDAYVEEIVLEDLEEAIEKIDEEDLQRIIAQKELDAKMNRPRQFKTARQTEQIEVDLHIHELVDNDKGLEPKDMLEIQMNEFRKTMDRAMKEHIKKVVFIHGVGNGRLRTQLRKELEKNYKHCRYQDASFREYGYGATLVILHQK